MSIFDGFKFWIGKTLAELAELFLIVALVAVVLWWLERKPPRRPSP